MRNRPASSPPRDPVEPPSIHQSSERFVTWDIDAPQLISHVQGPC